MHNANMTPRGARGKDHLMMPQSGSTSPARTSLKTLCSEVQATEGLHSLHARCCVFCDRGSMFFGSSFRVTTTRRASIPVACMRSPPGIGYVVAKGDFAGLRSDPAAVSPAIRSGEGARERARTAPSGNRNPGTAAPHAACARRRPGPRARSDALRDRPGAFVSGRCAYPSGAAA